MFRLRIVDWAGKVSRWCAPVENYCDQYGVGAYHQQEKQGEFSPARLSDYTAYYLYPFGSLLGTRGSHFLSLASANLPSPTVGFDFLIFVPTFFLYEPKFLDFPRILCYNVLVKQKQRQCIGVGAPTHLRRCRSHLHNGNFRTVTG